MRCSSLAVLEQWAVQESLILPFLAPLAFGTRLNAAELEWNHNCHRKHQHHRPLPSALSSAALGYAFKHATRSQYPFKQLASKSDPRLPRGQSWCCSDHRFTLGNSRSFCSSAKKRKHNHDQASSLDIRSNDQAFHSSLASTPDVEPIDWEDVGETPIVLDRVTTTEFNMTKSLNNEHRTHDFSDCNSKTVMHDPNVSMANETDAKNVELVALDENTAVLVESQWAFRMARLAGLSFSTAAGKSSTGKRDVEIRCLAWLNLHDSDLEKIVARCKSMRPKLSHVWHRLMLHLLETDVPSSLRFLMGTLTHFQPRVSQFMDVIELLTTFMDHPNTKYNAEDKKQLCSVVELALDMYDSPTIISRRTMYLFLKVQPERCAVLFDQLISRGASLSINTLCGFAVDLAKIKAFDRAILAIQYALAAGADIKGSQILKISCLLLEYSRGEQGNYQASTSLLAKLLEIGVMINVDHYNVLLRNAAISGDPGTVWLIYKTMCKNGPQPNDFTYIILLKMCRILNDRSAFRYVNFDSRPTRRELHPYLVTELLAGRYKFNSRKRFDHILRFYERHCDLQPLRDLGIVSQDYQSRWIDSKESLLLPRPSPPAAALSFMLLSYLRTTSSTGKAWEVYKNFQRLLEAGHPGIVPLVARTYTYNLFLKLFARTKASFGYWPSIVRDMARPLPTHIINPETGRTPEPLKPDIISWNIIINGLARNGQHEAARKLVDLVQKADTKPTASTWNSMLSGLSRGQATGALARRLREFEETGIIPDHFTAKALEPLQRSKLKLERLMTMRNSPEQTAGTVKLDISYRRLARNKARRRRIKIDISRKIEQWRLSSMKQRAQSKLTVFHGMWKKGYGCVFVRPLFRRRTSLELRKVKVRFVRAKPPSRGLQMMWARRRQFASHSKKTIQCGEDEAHDP